MTARELNTYEHSAIGLYAILEYAPEDFMELLPEESDDALGILYHMLTTPNPKHSRDTRELNAFGAGMVIALLQHRGLVLPAAPKPMPVPEKCGEDLDD